MYDEYGTPGSSPAHPDLIGRAEWGPANPYLSARDSAVGYQTPVPLDPASYEVAWDPAAELEQLLHGTEGYEFGAVIPVPFAVPSPPPVPSAAPPPVVPPAVPFAALSVVPEAVPPVVPAAVPPAVPDVAAVVRSNDDTAELTYRRDTGEPPYRGLRSRGHRRPPRVRKSRFSLVQSVSFCLAALGAVIVSMVSVFGGMVALAPLRHIASPRISHGLVSWWPLLVYGPWLAASLSVLRASLHQRRAVHAWCVVLFFTALTTLLCVAQAPRTLTDTAAAALPSVAAVASFQQLVRQITLTRPPRPPRASSARHRTAGLEKVVRAAGAGGFGGSGGARVADGIERSAGTARDERERAGRETFPYR